MSGAFEPPTDCESFADDLVELALGTSEGRRRSEVLDHVAACPSCRAELESLSAVAESVQQLTPPVQPPLGFEMRLAERLQGGAAVQPPASRRSGGRVLAIAAAVALLAFGIGAVVASVVRGNDRPAASSGLVSADFTAGGKVVGDVLISRGDPGWMLVSTEGNGWKGPVTCEVTLTDGTVTTIGTFTMSGEYGVWATPLDPAAAPVRSARLLDADGTVLADAQVSV